MILATSLAISGESQDLQGSQAEVLTVRHPYGEQYGGSDRIETKAPQMAALCTLGMHPMGLGGLLG